MCESLGKCFLIIINIVFFVCGGLLLALGLISIFKEDLLYQITDLVIGSLSSVFEELKIVADIDLVQLIKTNAIILCVIGGVLFILGFLGLFGACKKSKLLLNIYATLVLILLAVQVGLGVYAYMYSDKFEKNIQKSLRLALFKTYEKGYRFGNQSYIVASPEAQETAFDALQIFMQCCGVTNKSEWLDTDANWNRTYLSDPNNETTAFEAQVPPSCCKIKPEEMPKNEEILAIPVAAFMNLKDGMRNSNANVNDKVCYNQLRDVILANQTIIIVIFIIIVLVQVLAVACACYLKDKEK